MGANEAQLAAYANNGRDWDQLCQALVWNWCDQFGSAPVVYASALDAYYATPIVSTDIYSAPAGACLFFDIGAYGHTDIRVDNGRDGMASGRVSEFWGVNAGEVDIASYIAQTGAWPLGWGWTNGANSFTFEPAGTTPDPQPEPEESDMRYIWTANRGGALVGETGYYPYTDPEYADSGVAVFGYAGEMNDRQFDVAKQDALNRGNTFVDRIADEVLRRLQPTTE